MEIELIDLRPQRPAHELPRYEPTPAEIAAACAEIRAGWDRNEEHRRRVYRPDTAWRVPEVRTGGEG